MKVFEGIGKKIRKVLGLEDFIKRVVRVNGKKITATYYPESGEFWFSKGGDRPYGLTNTGNASSTVAVVLDAFKDVDMSKISYYSVGEGEKDIRAKDRLYARELKRRGYEEVSPSPSFPQDYSLHGPHRTWFKKSERKKLGGLEKTTVVASIIGLIGGLFFLSSNLTGNVISNLNQTSSNWMGVILLVIGLIAGFFWLKSRKK